MTWSVLYFRRIPLAAGLTLSNWVMVAYTSVETAEATISNQVLDTF